MLEHLPKKVIYSIILSTFETCHRFDPKTQTSEAYLSSVTILSMVNMTTLSILSNCYISLGSVALFLLIFISI